MVLVGAWNVIGRYFGHLIGRNLTSNALIEIQWYLFSLVFLFGAAYALKHDQHVRVDVFYKDWNRQQRALANLVGTLFLLLPFSFMVIYFSWQTVGSACAIWELSPDPGGLPRCPIKAAIPIGFVLLILQGISEAIKHGAICAQKQTHSEDHHDQ
ncbi:MAG: TRAP transporter small permease subunit [Cyanothece sp. SIO1E1]|nr:TRAP transporter small permease subunit [Cyanothece sp. SIO1E1]